MSYDTSIVGPTGRVIADTVFEGCKNRTQVAAFMGAQVTEARVTGVAVGFIVGAVVGAVGSFYIAHKRGMIR
jgi:hypothetical protein